MGNRRSIRRRSRWALSPHAELPDGEWSYGYGLMIGTVRGVHVLEHGGSRAGYGSSIRMAPEQRVVVIVQTNRSGANLPATVDKAWEMLLPLQPLKETSTSAVKVTAKIWRATPACIRTASRGQLGARSPKAPVRARTSMRGL